MKFNFSDDNLSLFTCILVKESLISLYNQNLLELILFVTNYPVPLSYF
jgi:hypothetical protein